MSILKTDDSGRTTEDESVHDIENSGPHYLSDDGILLFKIPDEKELPKKPPPTPKELVSDCYVTILPNFPDNVSNIEIPYVREIGIRESIGMLSSFFNCNDYKNNLVQFWFLDVIVDCIWRAQDEFRFAIREQKLILDWILFMFKLIRSRNMTKQLMFQIFNDAMKIAEDYVQSGGVHDPVPSRLFIVNLEDNTVGSSISSLISSSSTIDRVHSSTGDLDCKPSDQYIVIISNEEQQVYKLTNQNANLDCTTSSVEVVSENEFHVEEPVHSLRTSSITQKSESSYEFYKVVMSTPPRFRSLQELSEPPSLESTLEDPKYRQESIKSIGDWHTIPRKKKMPICPSKMIVDSNLPIIEEQPAENESENVSNKMSDTTEDSTQDTQLDPDDIFKAFYEYNLWMLRNEFMNNPDLGWIALESDKDIISQIHTSNHGFDTNAFASNAVKEDKELFVKSCVLMAIRQIVFDYFDQGFAYEVIRISLTNPQFLLTQDINVEWNIPKEFKGDFKKPVPKKVKKEKPIKEPKPKSKKEKSKSSKGSKASKGKAKDKKSKKEKKSKSDKKSKSSKSDKTKQAKLTNEEMEELQRQAKEQEELERELIKQAENKMFMFPLKEAVDEKFFSNLFPNFKPKSVAVKSDKASKSSKESKTNDKTKKEKKKRKK